MKQFIENDFSESYYPTTDAMSTKTITYNGVEYPCEIIDTAGQVCVSHSLLLCAPELKRSAGRVLAAQFTACYWNTRLRIGLLDRLAEQLQHDTSHLRQDLALFGAL